MILVVIYHSGKFGLFYRHAKVNMALSRAWTYLGAVAVRVKRLLRLGLFELQGLDLALQGDALLGEG